MIVVACGIVGARALYVVERYGDSSLARQRRRHLPHHRRRHLDLRRHHRRRDRRLGLRPLEEAACGRRRRRRRASACCSAWRSAASATSSTASTSPRRRDLPWAVTYSHPNSPGFFRDGRCTRPSAYEMIGDLVILGSWPCSGACTRRAASSSRLAFLLYAVMRFFVSFLRIDSKEPSARPDDAAARLGACHRR